MAVELFTLPPVVIATGGVAVPLTVALDRAVTSVTLQAEFSNTGNVSVGGSAVTPSSGIEIPPGDTAEITADSARNQSEELLLSSVYVNSATSGNGVRVIAFRRVP